ncbi:hypothetical protein F0562_023479 [Nyssa sinensis]|uniref:HPP transmembrane region domain-containing protein n=1 Tax=Nyssa sinensis TaxID=561372 RepID=A0A5J5BGW9_9ASTE|nr:hypothetical protein F0562_023479 [Nyssa sinensis]
MGMLLRTSYIHCYHMIPSSTSLPTSPSPISLLYFDNNTNENKNRSKQNKAFGFDLSSVDRRSAKGIRQFGRIVVASSSNVAAPFWDSWKPEKGSNAPSLSDILWPAAGAFIAMATLGKMDQMLAPKGISMTIAPLGAVCAVLFATPSTPGARKYNMFMAQIGCAAIGVLAFSIFGPAASLPLLFIDGAKLHHLNFWYALFPGATACILLCMIQEVVCYLKENFKF